MFEVISQLDAGLIFLLVFAILAACAFEFVNGFHDTANAVATVIYTNSLMPKTAVILSGICNFVGVFAGGISVAMGIVNLLPVEAMLDQTVYQSTAMILALLLTAIFWNLGTWYLGIPCSSSHTLIASILGVGITYTLLPNSSNTKIDWSKAGEIGMSLLISPLVGFILTILFMYLLKRFVKDKKLYKQPEGKKNPPTWIRAILIGTCSSVSFTHGSNDGQKGVGLLMLVLIAIVPSYFALNPDISPEYLHKYANKVGVYVAKIDSNKLSDSDKEKYRKINKHLLHIEETFKNTSNFLSIADKERFKLRKDIIIISKNLEKMMKSDESSVLSEVDKKGLKKSLESFKEFTDYAPFWTIFIISISLGLGTMVGWERIVKTLGEKIGKEHLTYAQGASAEMAAAATIAFSTFVMKLPVSTTQVLSSGIAGAMVGSKGVSNLQPKTIKSIVMAWLLTFPVCVVMSGLIYVVLYWIMG